MIGLIGAMDVEIESLEAMLEDRRDVCVGMDRFAVGKLFGHEAVLAVCGPGKVNAALCAQSMITCFHPEWILNLGVAGSGSSDVGIGDMVIAAAAVQHDVFGAIAIEMEGAAVAHACYMHGTPCGILRSISDNADGGSDMDYLTFRDIAASHSQQVIHTLLKEETSP